MSKVEGSSWEAPCVTLYGTKEDGSIYPVKLNSAGGISTTELEAALMNGDAFTTNYSAAIATDTTLTLLAITTATTKYTNLTIDLFISCNCDIALYELLTAQAVAGTASTTYNKNRNSAVTSSTTVTRYPSAVTVSTTILYSATIPTAQVVTLPTFRLAASKRYYLLLTPKAAGTNTLGAVLNWVDQSTLS